MKRYIVLIASIIIQVCLGSIYAWSAFVQPLNKEYFLSITHTQLIFGITIAIFTLTMVLAGRFYQRYGPKITATIGGVLFGLGYLVASASQGDFGLLVIGIALLSGMGIGFGYICPLAVSIRWFPRHKGLVTGLAVGGFGAGAIIVSSLTSYLLHTGFDVLTIFQWIGLIYGLTIIGGAQFLALPGNETSTLLVSAKKTLAFTVIIGNQDFPALAGGIFCGTFAGLMVVGNLGSIGFVSGLAVSEVAFAVSAFAIGNGLGRVTWGWLYDVYNTKAITLSLVVLAGAVFSLGFLSEYGWLFILISTFIGFGFGANFVLYATYVAQKFGSTGVGTVYPLVFLFYGISGILGPVAGGYLFDVTGSYLPSIIVASVVALLGVVMVRKLGRCAPDKDTNHNLA